MTKPTVNFDVEATLTATREGANALGKDGFLTPLLKQLTEAAMEGELEAHLASETTPDRKWRDTQNY